MRAVQYSETGGPDKLSIVDLPTPKRKKGQVLIQVAAVSLNAIDTKVREGKFMLPILQRLPKTPGADIAGTVKEADAGSQFKPGDRVFAMLDTALSWVKAGTYAELVSCPGGMLAHIPEGVSFEQAAAMACVGLTFLQALPLDRIKPSQRVLIHAGAGGVGHLGTQLAKHRGAYVITTASLGNKLFCKRNGADVVIDYKGERFDEILKNEPVDAVVDTVGGNTTPRSLAIVKRTGYYAHVFSQGWLQAGVGPIEAFLLEVRDVLIGMVRGLLGWGPKYVPVGVQPNPTNLEVLAGLVAKGKLDVHIDKIFPMTEVVEAFKYYEGQSSNQGKVVLKF